MSRYRYVGHNGKVGEADSPYFAIALALGREAADGVDVEWGFDDRQEYSQQGDIAEVHDDHGIIGRLEHIS